MPSLQKSSSESSLEEVFLDSPLAGRRQPRCHNVVHVNSPDNHSISSFSSGGSYPTKWVPHGNGESVNDAHVIVVVCSLLPNKCLPHRLLSGGDGPSEFISTEKKVSHWA